MDIKAKITEMRQKVTDLQVQIFNLSALKKKHEKQIKNLEKLNEKVDSILQE